ncbi:MAG: P-loop NTPase [Clostridia bacterium]
MNKEIIIIAGHYGVGKTNIAINMAIDFARENKKVAVCDIDVVNPYFKTADAKEIFASKNIRLIMPNFANTNLDIPSLPAEIKSLFLSDEEVVIFDMGGDDQGATAISVYKDEIIKNGYSMYYVISEYRPMIKDPKNAYDMLVEIQNASGLKATAIINNSSIGIDTTATDIESSCLYAEKVAKLCNLDIKATTVMDYVDPKPNVLNMYVINNYTKTIF